MEIIVIILGLIILLFVLFYAYAIYKVRTLKRKYLEKIKKGE